MHYVNGDELMECKRLSKHFANESKKFAAAGDFEAAEGFEKMADDYDRIVLEIIAKNKKNVGTVVLQHNQTGAKTRVAQSLAGMLVQLGLFSVVC